ncbi:MAG: hypothetical protein ACLFQR_10065 [Desulfovibrionales bacterium]
MLKNITRMAVGTIMILGVAWAQDATINYPKDQDVESPRQEETRLEKRQYEEPEGTVPGAKFDLKMEQLDQDGDGAVTLQEFRDNVGDRYLDAAFHAMDFNNDGTLTEEELARMREAHSGSEGMGENGHQMETGGTADQ